MPNKKLIIFGAGGFGTEALWLAQEMEKAGNAQWDILGFFDDTAKESSLDGLPIYKDTQAFSGEIHFHVALGCNASRSQIAARLLDLNWQPATLVHPSAIIAETAIIKAGSFIGPQAVIAPHAQVGRFVIINSFAGIGHHSILGDFAHISPGAIISGRANIMTLALVGSNATVRQKVSVGEGATLAANSLAVSRIKPESSVIGVPARSLFNKQTPKKREA